ncbi:unnamed protein product [Spirodela intermedia]|uniref:Glutaredoxin domain-containing protein n=2 Tax=Spirodela intermedia TaxID=51605 RepID=A0A7I8K8I9_SPIIN|nr:unnamed protein product [Spirodela intermedia]CAA6657895.1 unnamed protein product [Spirodela intermedia]CAA7394023.1 unnamed protein product [Spirodela intermedia]
MQLLEEWWGEREGKAKDLPAEKPERRLILGGGPAAAYERVRRLAAGNAVVVFSLSGCCMCHVVKRLLLGLGVGPAIYELDIEKGGTEIQAVLRSIFSATASSSSAASPTPTPVLPAVFVGGKLVGGLEAVMACHISGTLIPLLKEAGALWL